jgi:hypothetical protein
MQTDLTVGSQWSEITLPAQWTSKQTIALGTTEVFIITLE